MNKLLLIVFILISVNCIAQNRFVKLFNKADSIYNESEKKAIVDHAMKLDGKDTLNACCSRSFYNCIYDTSISSDKRKNLIVSERDYLNDFMSAYQLGQLSFYYNKDFNYDVLEDKLKKMKRELRKHRK